MGKTYAFLFLAALLYGQGFPNHLGIIIPIGPIIATSILFAYLFQPISWKKKCLYYFFYNTVLNIHSFSWITGTLQEFGALPFIVAAVANAFYAFVFNPHIWLLIFLLAWIHKKKPAWELHYFKSGIFSLIASITLTLIEYYIPQQFPVMIGQPWIEYPSTIGLAPYVGLVGFSFFSYLATFEILSFKHARKLSILNIAFLFVFCVSNLFYSQLGMNDSDSRDGKTFSIRLVQANISNFLKLDSEKGEFHSVESVLNKYEELSMATSEKKLDLIVWPETAYPYPIYTNGGNLLATKVPTIFSKIVFEKNTPILFGGYDHYQDNEDGSYYQTEYNSALLINTLGQLEKVYHKHVLIPFGETLPFGPLNEYIGKYLPEIAFFKAGEKKVLFETENNLKFITTICYEKLRPEFLRDYLNDIPSIPHIMINLTNDSWYGNTLEPELHLFLARWRSAEFALPTLRSTNTGVSVYIDRMGQEVARLDYDKSGNLDISTKPEDYHTIAPTLFQKYGILTLFCLWLVFFIFHVILIKYKHDKNPS